MAAPRRPGLRSLPGRSLPGRSLPGRSLPGRSVPGQSLPGRSLPGRSLPGRSLPGRSLPGRSVPGRFRSRIMSFASALRFRRFRDDFGAESCHLQTPRDVAFQHEAV